MPDLSSIPDEGSASAEVRRGAVVAWMEGASAAGVDLSDFDPDAPLDTRIEWARRHGLTVGAGCTRYSTEEQRSTEAQVSEVMRGAAARGIFIPVEYVCCDEGVSGRVRRRPGLRRLEAICAAAFVAAVAIFKFSRLFRSATQGYAFVQQTLVEQGIRCIAVAQGIDTADERIWRPLVQLHGLMDEMLIEAIGDHVRAGLGALARRRYVTGALPVGYHPVEVDGPLTNRGRPRTVPGVTPQVAEMIRRHFEWVRDGMSLREGLRRWIAEGGPCDPRSTTRRMTPTAYRRMLSNPRYIGRWFFGRRRNRFSTRCDYVRQVDAPESEVILVLCEELRIVDDETFFAVQARLERMRTGARGPRRQRTLMLCDFVTDLFHCGACEEERGPSRFHVAGAHGRGMQCKHGVLCPRRTTVDRRSAVSALCETLAVLLLADLELMERSLAYAVEENAEGDERLRSEATRLDREIQRCTRRVSDLQDMAGEMEGEDRASWRGRAVAAQHDLARAREERARLQARIDGVQASITPEQVRCCLHDLASLLRDAACGALGHDETLRAVRLFRLLVGERILVHPESRPGRKGYVVQGVFRPQIVRVAKRLLEDGRPCEEEPSEVSVWLRSPPLRDLLVDRVHELYDVQQLSPSDVVQRLCEEGNRVTAAQLWQIRQRYWQMRGETPPRAAYNNGSQRRNRR